mmetsp:Transcript_32941/g.79698  ORF Transcript_32941/g.79698 Transcript_32941/m.79698 type:complete len:1072 (-) Transcript_32941:64-3279(-)
MNMNMNPTNAAVGEENSADMERQERIMDLAQQQQMALQRLDEVVENQRNLRDTLAGSGNNHDEAQQQGQRQHDDEEEEAENQMLANDVPQEEEDEDEGGHQPQLGLPVQNAQTRRQQRLHRRVERHDGGHYYLFSFTQVYFVASALLAFMAVVTSPSNFVFDSIYIHIRTSDEPIPPPKTSSMKEAGPLYQHAVHAVDAFKTQTRMLSEGAFAVDENGDLIDKVRQNGEPSWEAVVAHHLKTKVSSMPLAESPSNKKSDSQDPPHPHSPISWTGTLYFYVVEVRDYLIEQYGVLLDEINDASSHSHPPFESSQQQSVAGVAGPKQTTSSTRLVLPWEWARQKRVNHSLDKNDDSSNQSAGADKATKASNHRRLADVSNVKLHSLLSPMWRVINPSSIRTLLSPKEGDGVSGTSSATTSQAKHSPGEESSAPSSPIMAILDKIFTSTPRLLAIANLLLAAAYLLQTAVADLFLGPVNVSNAAGINRNYPETPTPANLFLDDEASRRRRAGRKASIEFLLFKLLLISAVLEPDNVDLFILLSWYTLLSFLRSLAHLAGATANHASQSGEPLSPGAFRLLMLVLACDTMAATGCVALFHATGWNMIFLLTCDCVLLGADALAHVARYVVALMEENHRMEISYLEERQLELYAQRREQTGGSDDENDSPLGNITDEESEGDLIVEGRESRTNDNDDALEYELREIENDLELRETEHQKYMASMETAIFSLEMFALLVTIAHFLHIWSLHGTTFGLVDGVLALHLHSTISSIGKKIAERRNGHRISQELNSNFPDANDIDIKKASAAGDVCCICLNSLLVGGVKKVGCGHLFHTNCLREVIERERSFAAAKCPLCRASLVTGRQDVAHPQLFGGLGNNETNIPNNIDGAVGAAATERQAQPAQPIATQLNPGEQSLLRFSTENILPAWIPVPAFAFEIVRRETTAVAEPNPNPDGGWQRFFRRGGQAADANNNDGGVQEENDEQQDQPHQEQPQPQPQPQQETSFWRRLLILVGAIPMSPEEEAMSLEQLVDMFPQYDRADLLRELRARRSAEAVAESILLGVFSGIPRGGGGVGL